MPRAQSQIARSDRVPIRTNTPEGVSRESRNSWPSILAGRMRTVNIPKFGLVRLTPPTQLF